MQQFAATSQSFRPDKQSIRVLVAQEVYLILSDIKIEIERKIKEIDGNIHDIRNTLKNLTAQNDMTELVERVDRIEVELQSLKYLQQSSLRGSRSKSSDKQRKPIFKKVASDSFDVTTLIQQLQKGNFKKEEKSKPPLPKPSSSKKLEREEDSSKVAYESDLRNQQRPVSIIQNPVLVNPDKNSLRNWLKPNEGFSCLDGIIKEEDIEESVYH